MSEAIDARALLQVALHAAGRAADVVRAGFRKHPAPTHKGRMDLVTQFDLDSEALLRRELALAAPFPVVGEERGGERAAGPDSPTW
ncbi:MAG TPA: hypothetical protein VGY54_25660, partial [Polyangiaceae bacterium]|nr:hypothetical protein [Polyangiaceae bacterium]